MPERFCKCGAPHDGWPGKDGRELCQMCWEGQCSDSWWQMMEQLWVAAGAVSEEAAGSRGGGPMRLGI